MYCYDCIRGRITETAAGICSRCGAALCPDHIVEEQEVLTTVVPLGRHVPLPVKARRLLCRVCAEALSQPKNVSY